jgi:hypothetical protein
LSFSFATVGNGSTGNMGLAFKWAPIDFTNPLKTKGGRDSIYAILNEIRKKEDLSQIINKDMAVFNSEYFQFLETLKIQDNEEAKDEISKIIDVSDSFVRDELVEKYNITDGDIQQDTLANWLKKDLKKILEPRIINEMTLEINNLTNLAASFINRICT